MQDFDTIALALRNSGFESAEAEDGVLIVTIGNGTKVLEFEFAAGELLVQDAADCRRRGGYKDYYEPLREEIFFETDGMENSDIPYACRGRCEERTAYEKLEEADVRAEELCGGVDALADILSELAI